ncbi:MAG: hypothetical protein EXR68_00155 [Dehalococcoidia bacterium]|nr:hypothetical protein [Dehalococcoidia bacterium]
MWIAVLVLLIVGLGISRVADAVNELLAPVVPATLGSTMLSGRRLVLWIVAVIFGYVLTQSGYDPLGAVGIKDAGMINLLFIASMVDAANAFFRGRLLRA